jgi:hypothetical protein
MADINPAIAARAVNSAFRADLSIDLGDLSGPKGDWGAPKILQNRVIVVPVDAAVSTDTDAATVVGGLNRIAERIHRPVQLSENARKILMTLTDLRTAVLDGSATKIEEKRKEIKNANIYNQITHLLETSYHPLYVQLNDLITSTLPSNSSNLAALIAGIRNRLLWFETETIQQVFGSELATSTAASPAAPSPANGGAGGGTGEPNVAASQQKKSRPISP